MKSWRLYAAALALAGLPALSSAATIEFVNQSSWEIHEIYLSPSNDRSWGEDYLEKDVLEKGDSLTITNVDPGSWDIMVVDEDGDKCVIEGVKFARKDRDRWVIKDKDLLACQANS
jgi:hypothetical protein